MIRAVSRVLWIFAAILSVARGADAQVIFNDAPNPQPKGVETGGSIQPVEPRTNSYQQQSGEAPPAPAIGRIVFTREGQSYVLEPGMQYRIVMPKAMQSTIAINGGSAEFGSTGQFLGCTNDSIKYRDDDERKRFMGRSCGGRRVTISLLAVGPLYDQPMFRHVEMVRPKQPSGNGARSKYPNFLGSHLAGAPQSADECNSRGGIDEGSECWGYR
jgi:hypothetical protein